jgi:hypothetical protein
MLLLLLLLRLVHSAYASQQLQPNLIPHAKQQFKPGQHHTQPPKKKVSDSASFASICGFNTQLPHMPAIAQNQPHCRLSFSRQHSAPTAQSVQAVATNN